MMGDEGQASFGAASAASAVFHSVTSIPNNTMNGYLGRSLETVEGGISMDRLGVWYPR